MDLLLLPCGGGSRSLGNPLVLLISLRAQLCLLVGNSRGGDPLSSAFRLKVKARKDLEPN